MITGKEREDIQKYLAHMRVRDYTINDDGTVDAHESVQTDDLSVVRWGQVTGDFSIAHSRTITSLKGSPKMLTGDFNCSGTALTSLEGSPLEVGGDFNCNGARLKSLKGAPPEVGGDFRCSSDRLTSLDGAPHTVGGMFCCFDNKKLVSLSGAPLKMTHYQGDLHDTLSVYDVTHSSGCKSVRLLSSHEARKAMSSAGLSVLMEVRLEAAAIALPKSEFIELMIERGFEEYL